MNSTQTQAGVLAPLVAALAGFLAGKGVFGLDSGTWIIILGAVGTAGATIFGAVKTRKASLAQTLGAGGSVVVTDAATAAAAPSSNVVSRDDVKVTSK